MKTLSSRASTTCSTPGTTVHAELLLGEPREPALEMVDPGRIGRHEVRVEAADGGASDGCAGSCGPP